MKTTRKTIISADFVPAAREGGEGSESVEEVEGVGKEASGMLTVLRIELAEGEPLFYTVCAKR
jgi:hypothetical protein